jgi:hypothetical protein
MGRTSTINIDKKKALELYEAGCGWREIGRALGGIHPFQISLFFQKLGLKANRPVGGLREWNTDKFDDMIYCGCSVRQAAKGVGISESTAYKYLRDKKGGDVNEEGYSCDCDIHTSDAADCSCTSE